MIFRISRTSIYRNEQPCEEASRKDAEDPWTVELKSLEDLLDFARKYNEPNGVILTEYKGEFWLEIYDDSKE